MLLTGLISGVGSFLHIRVKYSDSWNLGFFIDNQFLANLKQSFYECFENILYFDVKPLKIHIRKILCIMHLLWSHLQYMIHL